MRFACLLVFIAAASIVAQSQDEDVVSSLARMRDHNRPLIVFFASTGPDSQSQQQAKLIHEHQKELNDRDVVVVMAGDDAASTRRHPSLNILRRKYQVETGSFTVVLLGKDGNEKFRSHEPVTIEKLDALIDAMPMRQQEVRDGHHAK